MKKVFLGFNFNDKKRNQNKRVIKREGLTLAYQLGFYIGEIIVDKYLPTLNVDLIQTKKVISVSELEAEKCKLLNDAWFDKKIKNMCSDEDKEKSSELEWKELRAYHEMLEEKYLPKTLECYFNLLYINKQDVSEFKKGIISALYDCDCSHYSIKEEKINIVYDKDGFLTTIILERE